jgi:hypothetical protein
VGVKTRPYGHGLCSISSGMLLQDVTMYWQYLNLNGFRNYVASANLYFGFVIKLFVLRGMRATYELL